MWWSVYVATEAEPLGQDVGGPDFVKRLEQLAHALQGHDAAAGGDPGRGYHVQLSVEAADAQTAGALAELAFRSAAEHAGLPAWPLVRLEILSEQQLDENLTEPSFPDIVGVTEAAKALGITRQRLSQLSALDSFPPPMVRLAAGPVWLRASIEAFERRWPRQTGRPRKDQSKPAPANGSAQRESEDRSPSTAWAAASRAVGTRKGEHDT